MSEKEKGKELRFLIPIEKMPPGRGTRGLYDNILEEFIESGLRYAEVREIGKSPDTVSYMLKRKRKEMPRFIRDPWRYLFLMLILLGLLLTIAYTQIL